MRDQLLAYVGAHGSTEPLSSTMTPPLSRVR
jgi:hypothetical protein